MAKRVFLIVLDSFGVGAEPDAPLFGDVGTNTLGAIAGHPNFRGDNLARLGMFNLDGVTCGTPAAAPIGSYARLREASAGKDTTIGHWEIAGLLSAEPLPTFPDGFPQELLDAFTAKTGYKVLCNKPYSGTEVIRDYSLVPPHDTMLDAILAAGKQTIGVGKIHDIFAGKGIGETIRTSGNTEGLQVTLELADRDFEGLAFVNLVDFDMLYGHRRNIAGYAAAAAEFNDWLPGFMAKMRPGDILMVTADHGCDPSYTKTTDHTREHVPFLIYGDEVKPGVNLHTRYSFATIADTVCKALGVDYCPAGCGVYDEIAR